MYIRNNLYGYLTHNYSDTQCCQKVQTVSKNLHAYFSPDKSMNKFQKTLWKITVEEVESAFREFEIKKVRK